MKRLFYFCVMILTGPVSAIYGWAIVGFAQANRGRKSLTNLWANIEPHERVPIFGLIAICIAIVLAMLVVTDHLSFKCPECGASGLHFRFQNEHRATPLL